MKLYCISCDQIPWRKSAAIAEFKKQNLDVEIFQGIHGPTYGLISRLEHFENKKEFLSPGHIGLNLSNLLLWSACKEKNDEYIVILEDDAILVPDFLNQLNIIIEILPKDWDICNLAPCCDGPEKYTEVINNYIKVVRYPLCTCAMLYNKKCLPFLIRQISQVCNSQIDIQMERLVLPYLNQYCLITPLAKQSGIDSVCNKPVLTWKDVEGWFEVTDTQVYDEALNKVKKDSIFVELGSFMGRSTSYMAEEIKRRYLPVKFYAIDLWDKGSDNQPEMLSIIENHGNDLYKSWIQNVSRTGVIDFVEPIREDTIKAAGRFKDKSVDFLFIDSNHSYQHIVAELNSWIPKMKDDGLIAGHDILTWPSVKQAVSAVFGKNYRTWHNCWIVDKILTAMYINPNVPAPSVRERHAIQTKLALEKKYVQSQKTSRPKLKLVSCIYRSQEVVSTIPCGCSHPPTVHNCSHPELGGTCIRMHEDGNRRKLIEASGHKICQLCPLRVVEPGTVDSVEEWRKLQHVTN